MSDEHAALFERIQIEVPTRFISTPNWVGTALGCVGASINRVFAGKTPALLLNAPPADC